MKLIPKNTANPLLRASCAIFGHNYLVTRKVSDHIYEYKCSCCGKEVTNNYAGKLEQLTHQNKQANATLSNFLKKKLASKVIPS